jgi:predicted transcriptional regulator
MKVPLSICLDLDTRVELDRLAASELRSRSWLAEKFIRDGLVAAREQPVRADEATAQ